MKKLLIILFLSIYSTYSFAQLTEGKYKIKSVRGFLDDIILYENTFEDNVATIVVTFRRIEIRVAGYVTHSYLLGDPPTIQDSYFYRAIEIQSGAHGSVTYKSINEPTEIEEAILLVTRSEMYSDAFHIVKEK